MQIALLRQAPIWRRLASLDDLNRSVRMLSVGGLRSRFPQESVAALQHRLAEIVLGAAVAQRVYGSAFAESQLEGGRLVTTAIDVTLLVTEQLESLGVHYLLGGSLASSAHGIFRSTNDADIL
ncbi:MAG TPA: hypothetical protein VHB98_21340, partial [Chloroflexota bacterium]|nr:hypothetical protein [Chloroflexota bacterium]